MPRPARIWLWFGLALSIVLLALAGVSAMAWRLENRGRRAQLEADREQRFRLALWRLDAAVAVVLATENARPPTDYIVPSPLEDGSPPPARFHFQLGGGRRLTSPTTNPAELEQLRTLLERPLPENPSQDPSRATSTLDVFRSSASRTSRVPVYSNESLLLDAAQAEAVTEGNRANLESRLAAPRPMEAPTDLNRQEAAARALNYEQVRKQQSLSQNSAAVPLNGANRLRQAVRDDIQSVGPLAPVWVGEELFLARRVHRVAGEDWVQGVWLAWPQWSAELAANVADLLPSARLHPIHGTVVGGEDRRLVGLPVRLEAAPLNLAAMASAEALPFWTPIRIALGLAWVALLGASAAVAWLLHQSLQLSERRAAFVSAVTHELRTPLTTFQLYSEMLADDMVPDPGQRRSYLAVLRAEAVRLGHLVENVLAYSRLERGRTHRPRETLTVNELVGRIRERLDQRLTQAGMKLVVCLNDAESFLLSVDVSLMEQVWFNLVDNAAKYAGPAVSTSPEARQLHLDVTSASRGRVEMRLRDHGPGIHPQMRRHLFEPFGKSAEQAAHSAPGVGLGLSLCRRLVRSQGGELVLESSGPEGSVFRVQLPQVGNLV